MDIDMIRQIFEGPPIHDDSRRCQKNALGIGYLEIAKDHPAIKRAVDPSRFDLQTVGEGQIRSEEHTSELQSLMSISSAVFCLNTKQIHKAKVPPIPTDKTLCTIHLTHK